MLNQAVRFPVLIALLTGASCLVSQAPAQVNPGDWPQWRGPRLDGSSTDTNLPLNWSKTNGIAWKTAIPGKGHSSPIVVGNRIFVTSCIEETGERLILCFDKKTGKILWQTSPLKAKLEPIHRLNSHSSATPASDGKLLFTTFLSHPDMRVFCHDLDGRLLWEATPGTLLSKHGFCSSPIIFKDTIILNGDQDADGYLIAYEKETGKVRWRMERPNKTRSYCTPFLLADPEDPTITQLILSGSKCVAGYDAASGKQLWIHKGPTEQYVASLVHSEGILFLSTGFPEYHLMGLRADSRGDITRTDKVAWHIPHQENGPKGASYVPSPVAAKDLFFVVSDPGWLGCIEAKTGKRLWMNRLGKHHSASPIISQKRMYFPDDEGITWVVEAGREFRVLARNKIPDEIYASPAASDGKIYIRGLKYLWAVGP